MADHAEVRLVEILHKLGLTEEMVRDHVFRPTMPMPLPSALSQSGCGRNTTTLAGNERTVEEAVVRIESKLPVSRPEPTPAFAAMTLSDEERQIIRKFFGVRKKEDASRFDAKVGEIALDSAPLYPVPSLLYSDLPKLKDHRFFADEVTGTIILVTG